MIIARWHIDARFGHKDEVISSMRRWHEEIGTKIGWPPDRVRMMTGSVGAHESTIVMEVQLDSLAALDDSWNKLAQMKEHERWSRDLEPKIVSGSHRWEIYRML